MNPTHFQVSPFTAMKLGAHAVFSQPLARVLLVLTLFSLTVFMVPFGRLAPDHGGLLAPLTADSGYIARKTPAIDFFSVYDAGSRVLAGRDPFGVNLDRGAGLRAPYVATFRYLPITAYWLAVPLNILPPWPAYFTWIALNYVFLVGNFFLCAGRNPSAILPLGVIWFAWFPVIAEFHMGQFSLFMATLLLWGFDAMCSGRKWGGIAWGFAVMLKVFPFAMAPSFFLWGKRKVTVAVLLLCILGTAPWFFFSSAIREGLVERGTTGRIIGAIRQPYAGAQGTQELVNTIAWKLDGKSFIDQSAPSQFAGRLALGGNALVLAAYAGICLWALIVTRRKPSLFAIALFWMSWFVAYRDCWEHHYLFIQALVALLLAQKQITVKAAVAVWLFAGAPSMWWLWQRTGYSGNSLTEMIGVAYFLQRPIALALLTTIAIAGILRSEREIT